MTRRSIGWRVVLSATALFASASCGTDYDGTQEEATEQARGTAQSVQRALEELVSDSEPSDGPALLEAVRAEVPSEPERIVVFGSELVDDVVHLYVSFDGEARSGSGGTSYQFHVRLCVDYRVRSGEEPEVTAETTRCSPELLEPTGPTSKADRTVSLED